MPSDKTQVQQDHKGMNAEAPKDYATMVNVNFLGKKVLITSSFCFIPIVKNYM